jgi:formylglycine-generating enzyme required for sulfatase activity
LPDDGGTAVDSGGDGGVTTDASADGGSRSADAGAPTVPGTWILIEVSGTPFTMGAPVTELGRGADEVEHAVTLTRDYWLTMTEITQQQFLDEMGYNPSHFSSGGAGAECGMNCPVEMVNWHEVAAYANALSVLEGLGECYSCIGTAPSAIDCAPNGSYARPYDCPGYRLPTEAEWEYAARGGTSTATHAGQLTATDCTDRTLGPIAWFCGNASGTTHPVGTKTANAYGLHDVLGNVWEWCHDWHAAYPGGSETDPEGPFGGSSRVLRGGSWHNSAGIARAAVRNVSLPGNRIRNFGGRVARSGP